jgi:hypothetical protein
VYICLVDDFIKVGHTNGKTVKKRLKQHAKGLTVNPEVRLLCAVRGTRTDEKAIQSYFAANACRHMKTPNGHIAELFDGDIEITDYIRWLRSCWFVTTDEDVVPKDTIPFDRWRPTPGRRMSPPESLPLYPASNMEFPVPVVTADDYYTPEIVIACVHSLFGEIDLDPASHVEANRIVRARNFFQHSDNGLTYEWNGRVWVNPPFSQWKLWVPKIMNEVKSGRVEQICVYSAMRTITTKYFRPFLDIMQAMCVITGRIRLGGMGEGGSPDDGHCVFYWGSELAKFQSEFGAIGSMWNGHNQNEQSIKGEGCNE